MASTRKRIYTSARSASDDESPALAEPNLSPIAADNPLLHSHQGAVIP